MDRCTTIMSYYILLLLLNRMYVSRKRKRILAHRRV